MLLVWGFNPKPGAPNAGGRPAIGILKRGLEGGKLYMFFLLLKQLYLNTIIPLFQHALHPQLHTLNFEIQKSP